MPNGDENYDILTYLEDYVKDYPDKEIRVINAAINLFSEKGFSATSTKEISKRADMAEGTIFRYFPTKDAILERMVPLLIHAIKPKLEKPVKDIIAERAGEPVGDIFATIILDRLNIIRGNGRLLKSVLPELMYREALQQQLTQSLLPMIRGYVSQVLEEGRKRAEIGPHVSANTAMHQLLGFILAYSLFGSKDEAQAKKDVEEFMDGVMKGWAANAQD